MTIVSVAVDIVRAEPSLESTPFATLVLRFRNDEPRPVRVLGYRVSWKHGSFEAGPADLVVPPCGAREWRARIGYADGDVQGLLADVESVQVAVLGVESA